MDLGLHPLPQETIGWSTCSRDLQDGVLNSQWRSHDTVGHITGDICTSRAHNVKAEGTLTSGWLPDRNQSSLMKIIAYFQTHTHRESRMQRVQVGRPHLLAQEVPGLPWGLDFPYRGSVLPQARFIIHLLFLDRNSVAAFSICMWRKIKPHIS